MSELRLLRKVRRSRLVVARSASEHVRDGRHVRSIIASQRQDLIGNIVSDADAMILPGPSGICANDCCRSLSSIGWNFGYNVTRTSCAAAAAAASCEAGFDTELS